MMILITILLLTLMTLLIFTILGISLTGAIGIIIFGDVIVCGVLIGLLIRHLIKKRKR